MTRHRPSLAAFAHHSLTSAKRLALAVMMKLFALALSVTIVSAGICNDKRPDCTNWARDNECMGDNAVCPRTIQPP